jgi:ABC-type Fe3+-hydroxamate transport system substrate-binding protein
LRWIALLLAVIPTFAFGQVTVHDDVDRPIYLRMRPVRIIALTDFLADLVTTAGAGARLVAVGGTSDTDAKLMGTSTVATGDNLSISRVLGLKPDLVLSTLETIKPEDVDRLTAAGLNVFIARNEALDDPPRLLRTIGDVVGADVSAVAARYEERIARLRRENAVKVGVKAFIELSNRPLVAASGNHFLSAALEVCQARNILGDWKASSAVITYDHVRVREPDVIIGMSSASNGEEFRANWGIRQNIGAVRARRLLFIYAQSPLSPSLKTAEDVEQLCEGMDVIRASMAASPEKPAS